MILHIQSAKTRSDIPRQEWLRSDMSTRAWLTLVTEDGEYAGTVHLIHDEVAKFANDFVGQTLESKEVTS